MIGVVFTNREQPPAMEEMLTAVGSKRRFWDDINGFVNGNYTVREGLKFYGKNFGWVVQYRRAGKLLLSIYPKRDALAAQVILGKSDWHAALSMPLGERAAKALRDATHYPEGCWILLEVETEQDVEDVRRLMLLKSPPPQKRPKGIAPTTVPKPLDD